MRGRWWISSADVLLVDSLIPDYGGNLTNVAGIESRVRVNVADVRQQSTMNYLVRDREVIFNLAGQVSHIDSMRDPETDLEINCRAQLTLLEACRRHNAAAKVVYAGTRQVYGKPDRLPVDENHLVRPADINGINKAAGEYYHLVYNNVFKVRACSLRLTNVYGPRQLIRHNRQGFIGWFIRLAVEGKEIQIFGDGSQLRDFVYVDDVGRCIPRAGCTDDVNGDVFNVGGDEPISHRDLAQMLIEAAGGGSVRFVEWPEDKRAIDIGSFYSNSDKFHRAVDWSPRVPLKDGLRRTLEFYRAHLQHYIGDPPVIPFLPLTPGEDAEQVRKAIDGVVERGWFVLGPELDAFETEFAAAVRAPHAIGVGTGTDAIAIALRALGIGPGDEVITSPLSAAFSALAIMMAGARPVFADIDPRAADDRSGCDRRSGDATHRGDPARAPVRAAGRHARDRPRRRPSSSRDRRGRVSGAPRDLRRTSGGKLRRGGRLLLLSDEESRRAGRRWRSDDCR